MWRWGFHPVGSSQGTHYWLVAMGESFFSLIECLDLTDPNRTETPQPHYRRSWIQAATPYTLLSYVCILFFRTLVSLFLFVKRDFLSLRCHYSDAFYIDTNQCPLTYCGRSLVHLRGSPKFEEVTFHHIFSQLLLTHTQTNKQTNKNTNTNTY